MLCPKNIAIKNLLTSVLMLLIFTLTTFVFYYLSNGNMKVIIILTGLVAMITKILFDAWNYR